MGIGIGSKEPATPSLVPGFGLESELLVSHDYIGRIIQNRYNADVDYIRSQNRVLRERCLSGGGRPNEGERGERGESEMSVWSAYLWPEIQRSIFQVLSLEASRGIVQHRDRYCNFHYNITIISL